MRFAAVLWLLGWAYVGLPWRSPAFPPPLKRVDLVPFRDGRLSGHVLNVLLFVPPGIIGMRLGWAPARVLAAGAAVSGATELSQLFSTRRVASTTDFILNTAGVAIGIAMTRRRRNAGGRVAERGGLI